MKLLEKCSLEEWWTLLIFAYTHLKKSSFKPVWKTAQGPVRVNWEGQSCHLKFKHFFFLISTVSPLLESPGANLTEPCVFWGPESVSPEMQGNAPGFEPSFFLMVNWKTMWGCQIRLLSETGIWASSLIIETGWNISLQSLPPRISHGSKSTLVWLCGSCFGRSDHWLLFSCFSVFLNLVVFPPQ